MSEETKTIEERNFEAFRSKTINEIIRVDGRGGNYDPNWQRDRMRILNAFRSGYRAALTAERERREAAEKALAVAENCLQRYADQDMWEFTYLRRMGGSCGDVLHGHSGHSCTKSEFMSKYHGWQTAQIALQQIADLKETK